MGKTLILAIDELAQGQTQAFQTVNDMVAALEEATNRPLTVDLSSPDEDYVMAELDMVRYAVYIFENATTDRQVTLPASVNTNDTNRVVWIQNASDTYNLTVTAGGATSVVIKPQQTSCIFILADAVQDFIGSSLSSIPHSIAFFSAGIPATGNETLRYKFAEAVQWPANMVGSTGSVAVNPSKYTFFYVYQNGTKVGDITIDSSGNFSFLADSGSAIDWAIDDVLTVIYWPLEVGLITFSAKADNGDTVTINDGVTNLTVTFGTGGGQCNPGTTATTSAQNLKTFLASSSLASTIRVLGSGSTLTLINLLTAGGGALSKSDADNDFALTAFATEASAATFGVTFLGTRS